MSAIATQDQQQATSTRPYSQWFEPHAELGISLIDHLYNRLDGAYPHKWRSNFPNQQAIDNWAESWVEAFEEESITPNMVRAGLKSIRKRCYWPPSCAEFIKACKPSVDPMVAYYEAVAGVQARSQGEMGTWGHPAIYWAAMPMSFDLGSQTYSQMKGRWERALADQMAKLEWEPIPAPMKALPAPGKSALSRENAAKMLHDLGASGVIKSHAGHDPKAWAKKIVARQANGDKTLSMIQIQFATEAMAAT